MLDVLVVGSGPAGLAAAAALGERGLAVGVLGPREPARWAARYGAWADELDAAGYGDSVAARWPAAVVDCGPGRRHRLQRAYAWIDNDHLAAALTARCDASAVRWMDGEAATAEHTSAASTVTLRDGARGDARLVVDCTGHRPVLVRRPSTPAPAYQAAVGWLIDAPAVDVPGDAVTLMDWRDGHLTAAGRAHPTFLYAYRQPDGLTFVEETSLAARPALSFTELEDRLRRRLDAMGAGGVEPIATERVMIPMGGGLPDRRQRVAGFGAAAGRVHPATGYSVAGSLAAAPVFADAVARELGRPDATPARAARAAWTAVWPADAVRRNALYRFGLEVLLTLDSARMQAFFHVFCGLPDAEWRGYLGDSLTARQLAATMGRFFAAAPAEVRARLAAQAMGPAGVELASGFFRTLAGGAMGAAAALHHSLGKGAS